MKSIHLLLKKAHFSLLIIFLLNLVLQLSDFRLDATLSLYLNYLLYGTGFLLCFFLPKIYKGTSMYYLFYPLALFSLFLLKITQSAYIFLLVRVFLFPFFQDTITVRYETMNVYHLRKGIVKHNFLYQIAQKKYVIFEKVLGNVRDSGELAKGKGSLQLNGNTLIHRYLDVQASGTKFISEALVLENRQKYY